MSAFRDMLRGELLELVRGDAKLRTELARALGADQASPAEWLSLREAGEIAGVHPDTVARWIREGKLNAGKAGRVVRVRRAELERLLTTGRRAVQGLTPEQLADRAYDRGPANLPVLGIRRGG